MTQKTINIVRLIGKLTTKEVRNFTSVMKQETLQMIANELGCEADKENVALAITRVYPTLPTRKMTNADDDIKLVA